MEQVKGSQSSTARTSVLVTSITWFALFSEGYDMGALGAVLPTMLSDPSWHLTPGVAGLMASAVLVGMFFGGYIFGVIGDRFGRKPTFLACLTLFSVASGLAALAPNPTVFAVLRALAGLGIGGVVPLAAALTYEYAPSGRQNRQFALMYTGYSLGIFASALLSFLLVQEHGWRIVIGIGLVPLLFVPLAAWLLPESLSYLVCSKQTRRAEALAKKLGLAVPIEADLDARKVSPGLRALFARDKLAATIGFWLCTFFAMILIYGLNTWLPQIMRNAGYDLGPSIMFLGVFALASSLGGGLLGMAADRFGRVPVIITGYICGAFAIAMLSHVWPLPVTYALTAVAGVGSVAVSTIMTGYLAHFFPPELRSSAVGICVSFSRFGAISGPLIGGFIAEYKLPFEWNFAVFSAAAVAAALSILIVPRRGEKSSLRRQTMSVRQSGLNKAVS
jgi:AAHS family benzoate transporter-like MFS transporter